MKQFFQFFVGLALAANVANAIASADHVGRYDFSYGVQADIRVRPIQVFDDGVSTYFQFRPMESLPAIFRVSPNGPVILTLQPDGPYLRADGVGGEYLVRLGSATGRITYTRVGRFTPIRAPETVDPAAWTPRGRAEMPLSSAMEAKSAVALEANSYATPAKGDRVSWESSQVLIDETAIGFAANSAKLNAGAVRKLNLLAQGLSGDYLIRVTGRDDGELKEGVDKARSNAIRAHLIANGAHANRIKMDVGSPVKDGNAWLSHVVVEKREMTQRRRDVVAQVTAPSPEPSPARASAEAPSDGFRLLASDVTLSRALKRWAEATNYQVAWEIDVDPPLNADGALPAATMQQAMESLAADMRAKAYDVEITIYANRVIRIAYKKADK